MASQLSLQENHAILIGMVRQWDRRLRLQQSVLWLPRALLPGLGIGIVLAIVSRLRPLLLAEQIAAATLALLFVGLLVGNLVIWLRRRSTVAAARRFDVLLNLDERTSTALELLEGRIHAADELVALQVEDARLQARAAHAREHLPLRSDRRDWAIVIVLAVILAVLLLLPNPQADVIAQNTQQAAALNEAVETLRQITENVASDSTLRDPEREQLLEVLQTSTNTLRQDNISPEEAFAALSEAQAALQDQSNELNRRAGSAQSALDAAANALRNLPSETNGETNSEDTETTQGDQQNGQQPQNASDSLQNLAQNASSLNTEQQQQAAQQLNQAAQALQNSNPQAAQALQQAAQAMQNGDTQTAQQQAQQAAQSMQQQGQQAARQQQSAQQMSQQAQNAQQAAQQVSQAAQQQNGQNQQGQQQNQQSQSQQSQQNSQQQASENGQQQSGQQPGQNQPGQQSGQQGEGEQAQAQGQQGQEGQQSLPGEQPGQQSGSQMSGAAMQSGSGDSPSTDSQQQGTSQGAPPGQNNNPDGQGERDYEPIYAPNRINAPDSGENNIQLEPDSSDAPVREGNFTENPNGSASVPYNQVYSNYQNAANQALDSGYVPLGLRDVVRDYFTSLEPGQ